MTMQIRLLRLLILFFLEAPEKNKIQSFCNFLLLVGWIFMLRRYRFSKLLDLDLWWKYIKPIPSLAILVVLVTFLLFWTGKLCLCIFLDLAKCEGYPKNKNVPFLKGKMTSLYSSPPIDEICCETDWLVCKWKVFNGDPVPVIP